MGSAQVPGSWISLEEKGWGTLPLDLDLDWVTPRGLDWDCGNSPLDQGLGWGTPQDLDWCWGNLPLVGVEGYCLPNIGATVRPGHGIQHDDMKRGVACRSSCNLQPQARITLYSQIC